MDSDVTLRDIEVGLQAAGISVARLCRVADIAPTNWQRWKAGTVPKPHIWARVTGAYQDLIAVPEEEAA